MAPEAQTVDRVKRRACRSRSYQSAAISCVRFEHASPSSGIGCGSRAPGCSRAPLEIVRRPRRSRGIASITASAWRRSWSLAGLSKTASRGAAAVADYEKLQAGRRHRQGFCRFRRPLFADTIVESTIARSQSSPSAFASRRCSRSTSCGRTPARCHSSNRRQHVFPDGLPGSCGHSRHGIPHRNTVKTPSKHARSAYRRRPGYRNRRSGNGNNGST